MVRIDDLLIQTKAINKKEAKKAINCGQVLVDGRIPTKISENVDSSVQNITYMDEKIDFIPHKYYLLHKPVETISANKDKNHRTVFDLLNSVDKSNLYLVGRLDFWTSGLLLITDNGKLGRSMLAPEKHVDKLYKVKTKEPISSEDIELFKAGLTIDGSTKLKAAELTILNDHEALVKISEGKNRQVRKMFLSVGKLVTELSRLEFGPLKLDENLKVGQYRQLDYEELKSLIPYFN